MNEDELYMKNNNVIQKSMGWSLFSEIAAKFVTPITNMILARILTPDAFGVLAICNMLVSFMDIITDAGFGKYLVQHDFKNENEKYLYADVAFWSNFIISVLLFLIIILNRTGIASLLGNSNYSTVISVASIQLIFTSLSSIQTGLFRRQFDFKKLFITRLAVAITPLIVAVPLSFITRSYWSLIIGNLAGAFVSSFVLTIMSSWQPHFFYSFSLLKEMFSYSFWSLCEGLANWAIFWIDTFMVTNVYSEYYIGIYKNSANMVMSIMGMISASMSPVLLSVLSRVKNDSKKCYALFLDIQRIMLYLVIPMGIGLFCYRNIITYILFGNQWSEAADIVGGWGLMMMCSVAFYSFPAELYKSRGVPRVLFLFQCTYLFFLIPVCLITVKKGFWIFVYIRCLCILEQIFMSLIFLRITFKFNILRLLKNMLFPVSASLSILISYCVFKPIMNTNSIEALCMCISALIYFSTVALVFKNDLLRAKNEMQDVKL